ncbi:retrotransposon protein [Cucumis melo var. makuwa]|uniref:Retrotransposon protein n=1 Tax=Cucumis melo var. makuwa TaxID=1194695 RepID=A0A5D3DH16_CUCMM|nr:retrotransposon protein [Cucumis melo var. makuwa]TYK22906.1 retrotransposon protein [Cucumis melo var. makuwa]
MKNCDDIDDMDGGLRVTGRFTVTFVDIGSNESIGYEGFDMLDGNEEFPSMYSQGIDMSQENVRASRPSSTSEGRVESNGSKRKRGSQQEDEIEVIHMALESLSVRTTNSRGLWSGLHAPLPMTTMWRGSLLREMPELTSYDRALHAGFRTDA